MSNNTLSHRRPTGFTLIETLGALILIAAVMLLGTGIFTTTLTTLSATKAHVRETEALDGMTRLLRQDVWSSARISQPDEHTLELTLPDGRPIHWNLNAKAQLQRSSVVDGTPVSQTFTQIPADITFTAQGATVTIYAKGLGGKPASMTFVSQLLMAGGAP